jgi:hypothetical protein
MKDQLKTQLGRAQRGSELHTAMQQKGDVHVDDECKRVNWTNKIKILFLGYSPILDLT